MTTLYKSVDGRISPHYNFLQAGLGEQQTWSIHSFDALQDAIISAKGRGNAELRRLVIRVISCGVIGESLATAWIEFCAQEWNAPPCYLHWALFTLRQEHFRKFYKTAKKGIPKTCKEGQYKSPLVDYAEKKGISVSDVLQHYGIKVRGNKALCPFHADRNPSLSFNSRVWKCWGCGATGNILTLIDQLEELKGGAA